MSSEKVRVGIVGFGALGQFLAQSLLSDPAARAGFELRFVWSRSPDKMASWRGRLPSGAELQLPSELVLEDLTQFSTPQYTSDVVIEVAHPEIHRDFGELFLSYSHLLVGSPTAFADTALLERMQQAANANHKAILLPSGALWGALDIYRMAQRGALAGVRIAMRKPPHSMKLISPLQEKLEAFIADDTAVECILYEGPIRGLCPLAPNNVNTMATAALASGSDIGFDRGYGMLVADKSIAAHVIELEVVGKPLPGRSDQFACKTVRYNPCDPHAVTASATYGSFLSSLLSLSTAKLLSDWGLVFC